MIQPLISRPASTLRAPFVLGTPGAQNIDWPVMQMIAGEPLL